MENKLKMLEELKNESLSIEDIKLIADKVMYDDGLNGELNDIINYYVWEYKKGK